jgi:hypothetical protein
MKKFIYTIVLLAGFQFAQAQQVTEISLVTNMTEEGIYTIPLQGCSNDFADFYQDTLSGGIRIVIPLLVDFKNTEYGSIETGSVFFSRVTFNGQTLGDTSVVWSATAMRGDTGFFYSEAILPASLVKPGILANNLCYEVTAIAPFVNGTLVSLDPVTTTMVCRTFTVNNIPPGVGIANMDNLKEATIFPNPVRDQLKIENLNEATDICLYNITGQLIQRIPSVMGNAAMDVSSLSNGLYILKMQNGNNIRTEKIQVIK